MLMECVSSALKSTEKEVMRQNTHDDDDEAAGEFLTTGSRGATLRQINQMVKKL